MFPLRDENPLELTPYITVALIALNVAVWVYLQGAGMSERVLADSVCRFGAIPVELTGRTGGYEGVELAPGRLCRYGGLTWGALVTSMFLHGSWLHLLGNMWFLWLFGNNIEDSMGHLRFVVFYLIAGLAAAGAHVWTEPASGVPMVGASGAISAVMGAYLLLYPKVRIHTLFIILIFIRILPVPAWLVLLEWFAIQLFYGLTPGGGAVAFWAHIGGFLAGLALVKPFENRVLVNAKKRNIRLQAGEVKHGGWW